jgi:ubiquinol-cytochrome c reductase cytochrome c subunit
VSHQLRNRFLGSATLCALALATAFFGRLAKPAEAGQQAGAAPPGNAENGKVIFNKDGCYECHGYSGQGGVTGARLNGNPISFNAFVQYVRAPKVQMPPYTAKVISDQELADVYAFIRSLPKPPNVKSIPLMKE